MKIIFAKHDNCNKEYCFEVPDGMNPTIGDVLWVETSKGKVIAVATSEMITGENIGQIATKTGAYLPLKKVIAYANREIQEYCKKEVYVKMLNSAKKRIEYIENFLEPLPF